MVHIYENDGKRSTARNHSCPASLLCVYSKIFEKLPNNRFVNHIKKCGLFSKFQYGLGLPNQLQIFYQMHLIQLAELLISLGLLSLLHLIYPRISVAFLTNSSLMDLFCKIFFKNAQLIRELIKGPLLGLIFSDYILMTVLMMLSLILLLSTLMILLCTLSVIGYKIFGSK